MSFDKEPFNASSKPGDPLELEINGVKAVFRYCPPGKFLMGTPVGDDGYYDEPQHTVTLTRGFWLLETPVTQSLWKAVMGENPSIFQGFDARPVEGLFGDDCAEFISKLNVAEYAPKGWVFDFPTEAEWEYACRAGTTTRFNVGDELTDDNANFRNKIGGTTPVQSYAPNGWGFYDMHGNVNVWCKDWYGTYPTGSTIDPPGASSGSNRVIRGGSWILGSSIRRSAYRRNLAPGGHSSLVGIRLALRSAECR